MYEWDTKLLYSSSQAAFCSLLPCCIYTVTLICKAVEWPPNKCRPEVRMAKCDNLTHFSPNSLQWVKNVKFCLTFYPSHL